METNTAQDGKVSKYYNPEMSLWKFVNLWSPKNDGNNPDIYAATLAKLLGVKETIVIKDLV